VGVSARLRRDQQVGRLFMGASRFFGLPLRSNVYLSRGREEIGSSAEFPTVEDVLELSAEQTYRVRRLLDVRYGYDFGQNRTTVEGLDFNLSVKVARFNTTGLVDRRDDPFDPARGWFSSANLELSREGLGSDINFLRSFLQAFQFTPLGGGVVLASAARFGVARTYEGEDLIPSERFYAGGATSVRGYRDEDLGPRSLFGDADGGHALLILNTELRVPVYRWLRSVGFLDLGNVYERLADITESGLQLSAGGGIRFDTPIGLLRLDIAAPLNPRSIDPKWRLHFGLGHAF
jgi:outer membrane protein assembly factor BamA